MVKTLAVLIGIAGVALAIYGWQFRKANPKEILSYGEVTALSDYGSKQVKARTRKVKVGHLIYQEVELSQDNWQECEGDCAETLRKEVVDRIEERPQGLY